MTAAARWRETRRTALAIARRVHHYGDPPDPRLQEDVDGDIWDIEDRLREAELALIEAVLERVQVSVMDDQGIPDPRTAADILAELERAP